MVCVNENRYSARCRLAKNAADVARVAFANHAVYKGADVDIVTAGGLRYAGITAQGDVVIATGAVKERIKTNRRVVVAVYVTI